MSTRDRRALPYGNIEGNVCGPVSYAVTITWSLPNRDCDVYRHHDPVVRHSRREFSLMRHEVNHVARRRTKERALIVSDLVSGRGCLYAVPSRLLQQVARSAQSGTFRRLVVGRSAHRTSQPESKEGPCELRPRLPREDFVRCAKKTRSSVRHAPGLRPSRTREAPRLVSV